jgi:hypothetical protein
VGRGRCLAQGLSVAVIHGTVRRTSEQISSPAVAASMGMGSCLAPVQSVAATHGAVRRTSSEQSSSSSPAVTANMGMGSCLAPRQSVAATHGAVRRTLDRYSSLAVISCYAEGSTKHDAGCDSHDGQGQVSAQTSRGWQRCLTGSSRLLILHVCGHAGALGSLGMLFVHI